MSKIIYDRVMNDKTQESSRRHKKVYCLQNLQPKMHIKRKIISKINYFTAQRNNMHDLVFIRVPGLVAIYT